MTKGIIFDLDGVLISTDHFHYLAWKKMAEEEGIDFDQTINHRLRGISRMESLEIILEKSVKEYSETEKETLAERKNEYYRKYLQDLKPADMADGALRTLNVLREAGHRLAIGSSSKNAKTILENIEITHYFDVIVDGTVIENSKPHPEVFLKAQEKLGLEKKDCYVIEDAVAGIIAANAAGIKSVAIGDARNAPSADYRIDNVIQVLDVIKTD